MDKNSKKIKLVSGKNIILMILAVCIGLGWYAYKYYVQNGQIDIILIFSVIVGLIICMGTILGITWWANKSEKED